jgi:hypothetical protein
MTDEHLVIGLADVCHLRGHQTIRVLGRNSEWATACGVCTLVHRRAEAGGIDPDQAVLEWRRLEGLTPPEVIA